MPASAVIAPKTGLATHRVLALRFTAPGWQHPCGCCPEAGTRRARHAHLCTMGNLVLRWADGRTSAVRSAKHNAETRA